MKMCRIGINFLNADRVFRISLQVATASSAVASGA
jgi:hypothetical protein